MARHQFATENEWATWVFRLARTGYAPSEDSSTDRNSLHALPDGFDLSIPGDFHLLDHWAEMRAEG